MMNRIAAVVVTYNRINLLKECIVSLLNQSIDCDILIVDNSSTDGTEEYVNKLVSEYSRIYYQNTGANIGGAGGFNFGMRWAVETGYDYIWIMDDDCLSKKNTLDELMNADEILNGKYGWLSSVVLWSDGHECKMNRPKLKKSFYEYLEYIQYGLVQAEQATFVSLFFRKDVIIRAGLPIKDFFIWGDDIEYTRRISVRMSLPCFVVGKSQVIHAMKENTGSNISTDMPERIDRYRYAFRNEGYLYRQEGLKGNVYYLAKCGYNIFQILFTSSNKKMRRINIILISMLKSSIFRPKVEFIEKNK